VSAVRYEDHVIDDLGVLRVERRARRPRADLVEIEEGGTGAVPQRPEERLAIGTIDVDRLVDITLTVAGNDGRDAYAIGESRQVQHDGADYSLTLLAVRFEPGGADRAVVRFRAGR
jgi:hypothetical protein